MSEKGDKPPPSCARKDRRIPQEGGRLHFSVSLVGLRRRLDCSMALARSLNRGKATGRLGCKPGGKWFAVGDGMPEGFSARRDPIGLTVAVARGEAMANEQGNQPSGRETASSGPPHTSCPSCRRIFVPTSREQQELEREGEIRRACKSCRKLLVIALKPDGRLDVTLDYTASAQTPAPSPTEAKAAKGQGGGGLTAPPGRERIHMPRSLARLSQAVRMADEKLGTAITAIGGMHECLEEIQAAQGKVFHAQLSERSHKAMEETVAACRRLEQLAKKLEQTSSQIFSEVQSKLLAPDGLRASLDVYHDWLLERCGDEEQRLRIIERLPNLFDLVEAEWQASRAASDSCPERDEAAAIERLYRRVRAWQESVGLVRFPQPGEPFDPARHDEADTAETDDPAKVDTVKEVVRSGYRFGSEGPILRRAAVVRWVRRQAERDGSEIPPP